jgi:hypothetical protein
MTARTERHPAAPTDSRAAVSRAAVSRGVREGGPA